MEGSVAKQFGLMVLFWVVYFTIIYSLCTFIYIKIRGKPPKEPDRAVQYKGRTVPSKKAWEERDRQLRKRFLWAVMSLLVAPLVLSILLRLLG